MRAMTSWGRLRVAGDVLSSSPLEFEMESEMQEEYRVRSVADETVWVFSSARVLIVSALLGPFLAAPGALLYLSYTDGRIYSWRSRFRRERRFRRQAAKIGLVIRRLRDG